jgi:molybdate transport system ATP-binding protein
MTGLNSLRARVEARVGDLRIDVTLDTAPGTLVIVGPNGAGKTSLLLALLGALAVERGQISVGDEVLFNADLRIDVPLEGRRLGYVPQDYALFPHLTVRQNLEFALASMPSPPGRSSRAARVDAVLRDLELDALAGRRPQTLSGGEKQRVALARALSVEPRALFLDEPLAAFDVHARGEVRGFLAAYLARLALPSLVVTHDAFDAIALGHRIAVLEGGRITQVGTFAELASRPGSRFVEEFVGTANGSATRRGPRAE